MGGNAFPLPAQRLSTPGAHALYAYARPRLAILVSGHIELVRYTLDKTDHGDIDVLCPCDWAGVGLKGLEKGVVMETSASNTAELDRDVAEVVSALVIESPKGEPGAEIIERHVDTGTVETECVPGHAEPGKDGVDGAKRVTTFCDSVARALQATQWIRNGYVISLAVPCHLVPGAEQVLGNRDVSVSELPPLTCAPG